jgi:hypothetical protein
MSTKSILILVCLAFVMASCTTAAPTNEPTAILSDAPTLDFSQPTPMSLISPTSNSTPPVVVPTASSASDQQTVVGLAFDLVNVLKTRDMTTLSHYVHPQAGLRFSPYSYIKDSDQVFNPVQVAGLWDDSTVYLWGNYDGTGEPINLTFADYYAKFVYDVDFTDAPQVSLNHRLGTGNSIDNSQEFYPGSMIVEFHFPGFDPQYNGMDWRSLRLVFMQDGGTWYLAGIIHDQWTI